MNHHISYKKRRELAGRARTLYERLDGPANEPIGNPPFDPNLILEEWKSRYPNEESFHDRLEREGLTTTAIRKQVMATHWPSDKPLPDWIDEIETLIQYVETSSIDNQPFADILDETAFSELIRVITSYGCEQLPEDIAPTDTILSMIEWLGTQIETICTRPIYVEFKSFINYHSPEVAEADPDSFVDPPTTYYDQFISAMFNGGFNNLCIEYPVLARHLIRIINNWVDAIEEIHQRIRTDKSELHDKFGTGGDITSLEPLAGDPHAGGRVPTRISFEVGEVIYKPRGVGMGDLFYTILDRLSDYLPSLTFEIPGYIRYNDYGWMEFIHYNDISGEHNVADYYERAGGILCLAYVLNLTDCQLSNVISEGDQPTIIDTETLFHPRIDSNPSSSMASVSAVANHSVLLTALLPWSVGDPRDDGKKTIPNLVAGFGSESDQLEIPTHTQPVIKKRNTDVMTVEAKSPTVDHSSNTPTINGEDQPPEEYVDAIISGFTQTYKLIRKLHAEGSFLSEIVRSRLVDMCENRLLYRPTKWYDSILRSAGGRDPLRDGVRFSIEIDELAVSFFDNRSMKDRHWPLYEAERKALHQLDIPRFTSYPKQETIFHDGEKIEISSDMSGYELCRQRLDKMGSDDLHRQRWLIRQSFGGVLPTSTPSSNTNIGYDLTDDEIKSTSIELFDDVIDAAIYTGNNNGWVSIHPTSSSFSLVPSEHSLYYGKGGIALTAAALYNVTAQDRYQQLVAIIIDEVINENFTGGMSFNPGGTLGVGSIVYVLSVISELFDEERYRKKALEATRIVTKEYLASDDNFGIMKGTAGTLLALLAYYDRYGGSTVLNRAIDCGDRLLEARVAVDGYQVWESPNNEVPITGFSHGSSGIAYALARLASVSDTSRYAEAVRQVLTFESTLYSSTRNNWAYSLNEGTYQDKWCRGRSGIALSRMGIREQLGDKILTSDLNATLSATAAASPLPVDHVCCGNFGRVETLLVGSRCTGKFRTDATELAKQCLARRERDGTFSFPGHCESFVNPSFFNGLSGVVHTLLRIRNPDTLPCTLLLE